MGTSPNEAHMGSKAALGTPTKLGPYNGNDTGLLSGPGNIAWNNGS